MDRVRFIEHRGQQVLLIDYSGLQDEKALLDVVDQRKELVGDQPPESVLTLTDISSAHFTRNALTAAKEAAVLDRPHLKRAAIVGAESVSPRGTPEAVATFSSRQWGQFKTREEALEWLVTEAGGAETEGAKAK